MLLVNVKYGRRGEPPPGISAFGAAGLAPLFESSLPSKSEARRYPKNSSGFTRTPHGQKPFFCLHMETALFAYANTSSPSHTSSFLASALQFPLLSRPRQFVDPLHVLILELHLETVLGGH